ncbi:MAG: hypothetical protein IJX90_12090 [Blautia sp.]|nr:hypothetical protein [Blautia sp.]
MKVLAAGTVTLAGVAGAALLPRENRRKLAKAITRDKAAKAAVFAAFGGLMYLKGQIIPKYADDYPYSFKWDPDYGNLTKAGQKLERVKTLKDLVDSQIAHYKNWDGRVLADFVVQLVLMKDDKKTFDVVNTLVMLAQLLACGSMAKGKLTGLKGLSMREVLLLTAGFWTCAPHLIATCFWLTGSVTYLWSGLVESLYVLPYAFHYHSPGFSIPAPLAALMGLAAGWSVETGAGGAIMVSGMELLRSWHKKEAAPWMAAGLFGAVAGMVLLLAAPGNRVKFRLEREMSDTLPESLDDRVPGYVPPEYNYTPYMFKAWFLEGFLRTVLRELPLQIPVFLYLKNRKYHDPETTGFILAMEAAAMAIPTVLMVSPEYPARAPYHSILYLLPASLKALSHIELPPFKEWSFAGKLVAKLSAGALAVNIAASLIMDADIHCQIRDQVDLVTKSKGKGSVYMDNVGVSLPWSMLAGNRSITWDVMMGLGFSDKDDPYNRAAAAYYGAESLYCGPEEGHRYFSGKKEDIPFSLINPLKSLVRLIREWIREDKWPSSCKEEA